MIDQDRIDTLQYYLETDFKSAREYRPKARKRKARQPRKTSA